MFGNFGSSTGNGCGTGSRFDSSFGLNCVFVKTATKYSLIAIGSLTVINGALVWMRPVLSKIVKKDNKDNHIVQVLKVEEEQKKKDKELELFYLRKPPEIWNAAFFFPDPDHDNPDVSNSSTKKLMYLLDNAKLSIKVSMYKSSFAAIETKIVEKYREGLIVQVVTCKETKDGHNKYQLKNINEIGIPMRLRANSGTLMHHKFAVIDDEAVITGSLNWTRQGITGNRENVVVTTDPRIVRPFCKEFATLWNAFEDYAVAK